VDEANVGERRALRRLGAERRHSTRVVPIVASSLQKF
jgi:hypothetical protein